MWTVANQLKGVLRFPGLGVEIPPEAEFDLDSIGRERAEASSQIKLALDCGYLRTVRKAILIDESDITRLVEARLQTIRDNLLSELTTLAGARPQGANEPQARSQAFLPPSQGVRHDQP